MITYFISYRRDDASAEALLIAKELQKSVGPAFVFMDSTSIDPGETWWSRVQQELANARFVLVVIGPDWLNAGSDEWGQRPIDSEADWVRREISLALMDPSKTVIPVLVRGGRIPPASALPDELRELLARQAIEIRRDSWVQDIELLIDKTIKKKSFQWLIEQLAQLNSQSSVVEILNKKCKFPHEVEFTIPSDFKERVANSLKTADKIFAEANQLTAEETRHRNKLKEYMVDAAFMTLLAILACVHDQSDIHAKLTLVTDVLQVILGERKFTLADQSADFAEYLNELFAAAARGEEERLINLKKELLSDWIT